MSSLYIRVDGKRAEWRVWPGQDSIPPGVICEGGSYIFELRDSEFAQQADLFIDDASLEALRSSDVRSAKWRWKPGFHAGVVEGAIRIPNFGLRKFEFVTDADLRKLARSQFDTMVQEILEDTFALFSLSGFRKGISSQRSGVPPPIARLEYLRSRSLELVAAVEAIIRAPRSYLSSEGVSVPYHRARRATGPEILRSLRTSVVLSESKDGPSRLPPSLRRYLPARVRLRRRRTSIDIVEHRQIKACLLSWRSWLVGVAATLDRVAPDEDKQRSITAAKWASRARSVARDLTRLAGSSFFLEVGHDMARLELTPLFRHDPRYRRFYKIWREINLGLASVFGDYLEMPLARTHELYETWCFFRLLRAAIDEFGGSEAHLDDLFSVGDSGRITIAAGSVTVPIGGGRALCFQKHYREYWIAPDEGGSFSRDLIPDLVLSGPGLATDLGQIIVLDAKYRVEQNLSASLDSIHTYRDALVRESADGGLASLVVAAYVLTPYLPRAVGGDFRSQPVPGRLFYPEYRRKFRFGAVTLKPGMSHAELRKCLRSIIDDATATV